MNDGKKILVNVVLSGVDYLVPAKLLCEMSPWFSAQLDEYEWFDSVVFTMATADVFESVLGFMCTGILRVPSDEGNELKRSLEVCMLACRLEMEELEWCAVGKVEEYFEANKNAYLPQSAIRYVLHNTQSTSHLHEWLATHVAGRLSTGAMCAEALEGVIATAYDFATRIIISMQTTVVEITGALLDMEFSEIRKAQSKVMRDSNYDGNSAMDDDRGTTRGTTRWMKMKRGTMRWVKTKKVRIILVKVPEITRGFRNAAIVVLCRLNDAAHDHIKK
jgi:hypothetical protein